MSYRPAVDAGLYPSRLADALDYLADLQDTDVSLSPETQAAIEEGLDDIRNGRNPGRSAVLQLAESAAPLPCGVHSIR